MTRGFLWTSAGAPLGDLLAVVEHGHAVGHLHDDAHVVLDQEDGQAEVADEPPQQRP